MSRTRLHPEKSQPRRSARTTRRGLALVATMLAAFVLVACSSTPEPAEPSGDAELTGPVLRVGVVDNTPYSSIVDGKGTGVCPDMIREALALEGYPEPEWLLASAYADLVPGLDADRWDIVGACLQINADRCEAVAFTNPLETDDFSVAVKEGNPKDFESIDAASADPGFRMGVVRGSVTANHLDTIGFPDDRKVVFSSYRDALDGLQADRADGVYGGRSGIFVLNNYGFDIIDVDDLPLHPAAAAVKLGNTDLQEKLNAGLEQMKESGTFAELTADYGFNLNQTAELTADEICASS